MLAIATVLFGLTAGVSAQETPAAAAEAPVKIAYPVTTGTRIPLALINSVSTRHAAEGDRVYLETVFPILTKGKIVIPPGSYVAGTVTQVKRPGRVKGKAELYVRFDSLTLPNGVTRDFRARISGLDGRGNDSLDRDEGTVKGEGNKTGDLKTIGEAAAGGTSVGAIGGAVGGRPGMGAGIGAAAGATAGLIGVLLTRGPEVVLAKGSTIEMVLDRDLSFAEDELDFGAAAGSRRSFSEGPGPAQKQASQGLPIPGRRFP